MAGADLSAHVGLQPVEILARQAWGPDQHLDLFADIERSAAAIGQLAGATEAKGYRAFCIRAQRMFETLGPLLHARTHGPSSPLGLLGRAPTADLLRISPFATLWSALGEFFRDPRLLQLFGRYSTYCGASPYLAPATLMLIAHAERDGVWLVEGGMHRLATAVAALARAARRGHPHQRGRGAHRGRGRPGARSAAAIGRAGRGGCRRTQRRHGGAKRRLIRARGGTGPARPQRRPGPCRR